MEEALLKAEEDGCCSVECVTELRSLRHLDRVIDSAASSVVVVAFYSRVSKLRLSGNAWISRRGVCSDNHSSISGLQLVVLV